jgi:hypothetical protein
LADVELLAHRLPAVGNDEMLLSNTARRTRVAPQSGQGLPTLLEEWHQEAASGGFRRSLSLMDQFQSLTPGAIAMRRLRHLREVVGWIRKL